MSVNPCFCSGFEFFVRIYFTFFLLEAYPTHQTSWRFVLKIAAVNTLQFISLALTAMLFCLILIILAMFLSTLPW